MLENLLQQVRACTLCQAHLPLGPRPVLQAKDSARILVVGQAPGIRVHESGIPWNDPSGDRLRQWMDLDRDTFYDPAHIAIVPMGFCYPGTGPSGDFPPRPECAATWHDKIFAALPNIELTLAIGQYAHAYILKKDRAKTLTETVRHWQDYSPKILPLPHPSPRNNIWLKKNPWFEQDVVPTLRKRVRRTLNS